MDLGDLIHEFIEQFRDFRTVGLNIGKLSNDIYVLFGMLIFVVAATALLSYEILLTFSDEVRLVWRYQ